MSSKKNRHGLSRKIPDSVKREVRQRCGFGCVICGSSIVDYEHIEPTFAEATVHDAEHIALLCPSHHSEVTRGFMSKQTVREASENPKCKQQGFSFGYLDGAITPPEIWFAGNCIKRCRYPLVVNDKPLFFIEPPEISGAPYQLSGHIFNNQGQLSLIIERNAWNILSDAWDVETSGGCVVIRSALRSISLKIAFVPREGIVIETLDMQIGGIKFLGGKDKLEVITEDGACDVSGNIVSNCEVGLSFNASNGRFEIKL